MKTCRSIPSTISSDQQWNDIGGGRYAAGSGTPGQSPVPLVSPGNSLKGMASALLCVGMG